jgi:phage-related protein
MKHVEWLGDSLDRLREFEPEAMHLAGYQLERVQAGMEPSDFKPMPSVGLGVNEIRIRTTGAYRVFYVAKFAEAVYVLHAFQKKGNKTPKEDLELGRRRFRALVQTRKQRT